ncbi:MAG TPA: hypothetical protein VJ739_11915 [Gemmataceae bacterium]|nr:hypothetical protein [Gemmataceae bacterium]
MSVVRRVAGLLVLFAVAPAWGQTAAAKQEAKAAPTHWTILFRSDDPSAWGKNRKNARGEQIAIPLKYAPTSMRYLRLRRMDTGEALILPLTVDQLENGKPGPRDADFWWNGSAAFDWEGYHLGIVQAPRHKFPAPNGMIGIMTEGWDLFTGSGFGHKCAANDGQYYCWRGKQIRRTTFEIAVTDGPLSPAEQRCLISSP